MSHVVIVGASKGIGRDIQPHLLKLGHDVSSAKRDDRGVGIPSDATGLLLCQRFRGEGDDWNGEINASLTWTKRIAEWAAHSQVSSVVVMASVAAVSVEEEQPVSYHACKAALVEMVKYYAVTLAPRIRVNAIIPGLTIKPEARGFYDSHPELEALYSTCTPMGRTCHVEDLANAVDFLIGPKSSYITGQTLVVDGGISLRSPWALARKVTPSVQGLQVTQRAMVTK